MLDLENIDEPDCINTLNEFFFTNYFRGYRSYLTFTSVMNELEKMGGLYGFQSGFHAGFGELVANLLVQDV